jgi:hypothetical protein
MTAMLTGEMRAATDEARLVDSNGEKGRKRGSCGKGLLL